MHTDVAVAIAQFRPRKGDLAGNLEAFEESLRTLSGAGGAWPDVVVFPEAAFTGYFLEGGVREQSMSAGELLDRLATSHARCGVPPVDVVAGFYELRDRKVYNAALYATLDGDSSCIVHVHRKVFLPTYGVFQEERFVEAGAGFAAFDTGWGRAAILICEDAFHGIAATLMALDGADVVFVPSASPARGARPGVGVPENLARWDLLGSSLAAEHGVFAVVSQLTGFEGGKGFAGGSAAYSPRGERLVHGPLWDPATIAVELPLGDIAAARAEEPLLADLERMWTRVLVNSPAARVSRPAARAREPEAT